MKYQNSTVKSLKLMGVQQMVLIAEILFEEGFPLRFRIPKESPEE